MISSRSLAWSILSIFAWSAQASAGWVIDQVEKGSEAKQQIMLQANQMKTVMLDPKGKPESAFIMDLNTETFTQVNYQDRSYTTAKAKEYAQMMESAMKKASSQMEEALKDMPPEQRAMMEKMMGSHMPKASSTPQACPEPPKTEIRKTGQQATIAGYQAVGYEEVVDGKTQSEVWIAKAITVWKELDPKKLERVMTDFAKALPRCGPTHRLDTGIGRDESWKLMTEGYPVRTVERDGNRTTMEVVKAENRTLPASEFQAPADFTRKKLSDMLDQER